MPRPKPNKLHAELDALLDGRPVELTDELAPLAEAADALRAELAAYQLDPGGADRHLERVLHGSATVVSLPVRGQPNGWDLRRRLAAVVLAAALVLVPATMASAAAPPRPPRSRPPGPRRPPCPASPCTRSSGPSRSSASPRSSGRRRGRRPSGPGSPTP